MAYIQIDGPDGSGKTTLIRNFLELDKTFTGFTALGTTSHNLAYRELLFSDASRSASEQTLFLTTLGCLVDVEKSEKFKASPNKILDRGYLSSIVYRAWDSKDQDKAIENYITMNDFLFKNAWLKKPDLIIYIDTLNLQVKTENRFDTELDHLEVRNTYDKVVTKLEKSDLKIRRYKPSGDFPCPYELSALLSKEGLSRNLSGRRGSLP